MLNSHMEPNLEIVDLSSHESFNAWAHGYPHKSVRWHFHPEYEIHLITATTGTYFVGDYIGAFAPGNLVMVGPDLPHNWVSDLMEGESVSQRCLVMQFPSALASNAIKIFPELRCVGKLLKEARGGLLFSPETGVAAQSLMLELTEARGVRRVQLFLSLAELLALDTGRKRLASSEYASDSGDIASSKISLALKYINKNFATDLRESDVVAVTGQSISAFSRAFHKHVGMTFVSYTNHLRIKRSCELLTSGRISITDICFKVGFNNVSNFNRQFLLQKGMSPTKFRDIDEMKTSKCT